MRRDDSFLTADLHDVLKHTVLERNRLEEQYHDLEQQSEVANLGMWLFLATEIMFFGALFLIFGIYHSMYPLAFETASERLNWQVGAINTLVLLVSSFTMVMSVHWARLGSNRRLMVYLLLTALLGTAFLVLKGYEYYTDYQDMLIPGWRFDDQEWLNAGLAYRQIPEVKLFLAMYWITTIIHAFHLTIGIAAALILAWLASRKQFTRDYFTPVDVVGLYWHFVDIVWIFLLPMLYLLGTHRLGS
jgi:cytochrome c oxidase subunit 3